MHTQPLRRRLLEVVQRQALPQLENGDNWDIVYASAPFKLPAGVTADFHRGKPLSAQNASPAYSSDLIHNWPGLLMHSSRFPCFAFVAEGSIDWRIGITTRMARGGGSEVRGADYTTLGIPRGCFLLIPPGVPYSEQDGDYWSRSVQRGIPVKVLWIQFHRFGMQCFLSYTNSAGEKIHDSACYVADSRTLPAIEVLIEELNLGAGRSREILKTLLLFAMQRLELGLQKDIQAGTEPVVEATPVRSNGVEIVEQACLYIEAHFDQKITAERVAAHVFISAVHLSRLFKAHKGISINEYLTRYRIDCICTLLTKTDLRINHIGKITGYPNNSYFCQAFQRRMGCSPQEYRDKPPGK